VQQSVWILVVPALLFVSRPVGAQSHDLDSLLRAHRHALRLEDGHLRGAGADLILEAAASSQFVGLLEEHNVGDLASLTVALFDTLRVALGYRYLALEQGGVITSWLGEAARHGGWDSVSTLATRWPHAPTFATDEELAMIAHIAATAGTPHTPVWGIDQEFGALHILERLAALAPNEVARRRALALAETARRHEKDRLGDSLYLAQVALPSDFADLPALFTPESGSETARLIAALQFSNRVFYNNTLAQRGRPTGYENMRERELGMKRRFLEEYARARDAGDPEPRVLLKLGHWHLMRGISRGNVPTFGNFASEFATAHGWETFYLSCYVVDGPEQWRNSAAFGDLALPGETFTVIDFRPLRPYAHQGTIGELSAAWKLLFFGADAALIIRGGRTGSYTVTRPSAGSR
jgi:hypothetical protein